MGIVKSFIDVCNYNSASEEKKQKIQDKKLHELVEYARKNSPYLHELYKNLPENYTLKDLPIVTKKMIMENYDRYMTDRNVTLEGVKAFTSDIGNIGKRYLGKYLVSKTSGSTGYPLSMLHDHFFSDRTAIDSILGGINKFKPVVIYFPMDMFEISGNTLMDNIRRFPFIKKQYAYLDCQQPIDKFVEKLNAIQPKTLYSHPSILELLSYEQEEGRLKISPKVIYLGSEILTEKTRNRMEKVFGCSVRSIYGCTEMGNVGAECQNKRHHILNTNIIIEPVDENNRPCKSGEFSHKVLYTNLSDHCMPLIRYEVSDNIILHNGHDCPCGNKSPWLEIRGRLPASPVILKNGEQTIRLSPLMLYGLWETDDSVYRFQLVIHGYDEIECRIEFLPGYDPQTEYIRLEKILRKYLDDNHLANVRTYHSQEKIAIDPVSQKLKNVYQVGI